MKILVLEYITGGGLAGEELPRSLAREGGVMLQALVVNLLELSGVELLVMRDSRLQTVTGILENFKVKTQAEFMAIWQTALAAADACWIIAPETDDILQQLTRQVEATGVRLLGCSSAAVAVAASQSQCNDIMAKNAVPTVNDFAKDKNMVEAWVVKPDKGAGSEKFHFFADQHQANDWIDQQDKPLHWSLQPWLTGESMSLCLLCKSGEAIVLSVNSQQFTDYREEDFSLQACRVNVEPLSEEVLRFADRVVRAVPGLWGYVGIDLLRTASGLVFVEINPRLTRSYAGLRQATGNNPASQVLSLISKPLPLQSNHYTGRVVDVV